MVKKALIIIILLFSIVLFGCKNPAFIQNKVDDKDVFIQAIINQSLEKCDLLHAQTGDYSAERCRRALTNESRLFVKDEYNECKTDLDCTAAGCSKEYCGAAIEIEDLSTDCTWNSRFACFRLTKCGCENGHCNWKKNADYALCLGKLK